MSQQQPAIVILGRNSTSTRILYHGLSKDYNISYVVLEKPMSTFLFIKKRIKKMGVLKVMGQVLFQIIVVPLLKAVSTRRIAQIKQSYNLNDCPIHAEKIITVNSVNGRQTIDLLRKLNPRVAVISGTRILSKQVLSSTATVFLNIHAGITPLYRGVHGGYWALANNDQAHCGVTVHLVDEGIDTGGILGQKAIQLASNDNFVTYPLLQLAIGIELLKPAIRDFLDNKTVHLPPPEGVSRLWSHPTAIEYLWNFITKGVR